MMTIILRDQKGQLLVLPPGFQFVPTDVELIKHYLQPKVAGVESSFPGFIKEKDLYGCNAEEPSQIFAKTTDKELYLFTKLKKKFGHGNGNYIDRVAGKGSWVIQHNNKPILDDEDTKTKIGSMKTFKFVLDADKKSKGKNNNSKEDISWLMQEYTLTSSQYCDPQEEWALCRIYKKVAADSGGTKRGRQSWLSTQDIDPKSDMPEMKRAKTLHGFSLPPTNNAPTSTSEMTFSQKDHDQYLPPSDHPQPSTYYYGSGTDSTAPVSVSAPFSAIGMTSVNPILLDDEDEPNNGGENWGPLPKEDDVQYYIEDDAGMLSDDYSSQFIDYNGLASTVEDDLGPLPEDLSIKNQSYSDDYSSQFMDQAPTAAQGSPAGLSDLQYVDYNGLVSTVEGDLGPLPEDLSIKDQSYLPLLSEEDDETIFRRLTSSDGDYPRLQEDTDYWCLSSSAMEMSSGLLPPVNVPQLFEDLLYDNGTTQYLDTRPS